MKNRSDRSRRLLLTIVAALIFICLLAVALLMVVQALSPTATIM